jgi:hypothetical protein
MAVFSPANASATAKVQTEFSSVANLVYQLDCVSGAMRYCSRKTYQALWDSTFLKGESDRATLKEWAALMERYDVDPELIEGKGQVSTDPDNVVNLRRKLRLASFQATTFDDYLFRLDLLVAARDKDKFAAVIRHFRPAFERWWKGTAERHGATFVRKSRSLLARPDLVRQIAAAARFYESNLEVDSRFRLNLIYRPESDEPTSGEQIDGYLITEYRSDEIPEDRMDVMIHELCHAFYRMVSVAKRAGLQDAFAKLEGMESRGANRLLNEALATAFGNGLVNKLLQPKSRWEKFEAKELSFYNDRYIDVAAKAALPLLETWLREGRTLYHPEFAQAYTARLKARLGAELSAPRLMLKESLFMHDGGFDGSLRKSVQQELRVSSMFSSDDDWSKESFLEGYETRKSWSALFVVRPQSLVRLKERGVLNAADFAAVEEALAKKDRVLFSFKRAGGAPVYLIVASNDAPALELIKTLGAMKMGFDGLFAG